MAATAPPPAVSPQCARTPGRRRRPTGRRCGRRSSSRPGRPPAGARPARREDGPAPASRRIESSRTALEKYLAIRPANRFAGSWPYSQVGMASPPWPGERPVGSAAAGAGYRGPHLQRGRGERLVVDEVRRGRELVDRCCQVAPRDARRGTSPGSPLPSPRGRRRSPRADRRGSAATPGRGDRYAAEPRGTACPPMTPTAPGAPCSRSRRRAPWRGRCRSRGRPAAARGPRGRQVSPRRRRRKCLKTTDVPYIPAKPSWRTRRTDPRGCRAAPGGSGTGARRTAAPGVGPGGPGRLGVGCRRRQPDEDRVGRRRPRPAHGSRSRRSPRTVSPARDPLAEVMVRLGPGLDLERGWRRAGACRPRRGSGDRGTRTGEAGRGFGISVRATLPARVVR